VANSEDALVGLQLILEQDFPVYLHQIELQNTDGVILENLKQIEWEEYEDAKGLQLPAAMLIAETEADPSLRDILFDCNVTVRIVVADTDKRNLTKKMFRYAKALRRMLKPAANRSLRGKVNSAKVGTIRWVSVGPRDNLFSGGFDASLVIRVPKEGD
jgi:hypothetical protein